MCFMVLNEEALNLKIKRAKRNITCYKVVQTDLKSYIQCYQYHYKVSVPRVRITILREYYWSQITLKEVRIAKIEHGYHSYTSLGVARDFSTIKSDEIMVVKCIIPKGTLYVKGDREYVSETVIIKRKARKWKLG